MAKFLRQLYIAETLTLMKIAYVFDPDGEQMDNPKAHEVGNFVERDFSKEFQLSETLDDIVRDK